MRRSVRVLAAVLALGTAGVCAACTATSSGPLYSASEVESACAPTPEYAHSVVAMPIEFGGDDIRVERARLLNPVNLTVVHVGFSARDDTVLIGLPAQEPALTATTLTVGRSAQGQVGAEVVVTQPTERASAGPFRLTYRYRGREYTQDAPLRFTFRPGHC